MSVKIHNVSGKKILAICNKKILGKVYMDKGLQLDLSSSFYSGTEISENEIIQLMKGIYTINAVGSKSIDFLIRIRAISKENVRIIKKNTLCLCYSRIN